MINVNHNEKITLTEDESVLYDYSKVIVYCNKHIESCESCIFQDSDFYCIIDTLPCIAERRLVKREILHSEKD